ncbi:MAG: hypothetical protein JW892_17155 [Anaerolineae bacterium]|nr:hypothetical protein [Anaerolineae bacterium]
MNPAWPSEPVLRFIPGTDSGTFDYFVEEVFDNDKTPLLSSQNLQLSNVGYFLASSEALEGAMQAWCYPTVARTVSWGRWVAPAVQPRYATRSPCTRSPARNRLDRCDPPTENAGAVLIPATQKKQHFVAASHLLQNADHIRRY